MVLTEAQRKQWKSGVLFVGEKGKLFSNYGTYRLMPEDQFKGCQPPPKTIPESIGHHAEWVKACREGGRCGSDFSYAGPLSECPLLGIVSHRLGNVKLDWDWKAMKAKGLPEADRLIRHQYRAGWTL